MNVYQTITLNLPIESRISRFTKIPAVCCMIVFFTVFLQPHLPGNRIFAQTSKTTLQTDTSSIYSHPGTGQYKQPQKPRIFDTWIYTERLNPMAGVLYEIKDSSLVVSDSRNANDYLTGNYETTEFNFNQIEQIQIRRNKGIQRGATIGAIAGAGLSLIFGLAAGTTQPLDPLETIGLVAMGFGFTIKGAGTGALIGSIRKTIPLERSYDTYDMNKKPASGLCFPQR